MTEPTREEETTVPDTEEVPAFMRDQAFSDADTAGLDNAIANTSAGDDTPEQSARDHAADH